MPDQTLRQSFAISNRGNRQEGYAQLTNPSYSSPLGQTSDGNISTTNDNFSSGRFRSGTIETEASSPEQFARSPSSSGLRLPKGLRSPPTLLRTITSTSSRPLLENTSPHSPFLRQGDSPSTIFREEIWRTESNQSALELPAAALDLAPHEIPSLHPHRPPTADDPIRDVDTSTPYRPAAHPTLDEAVFTGKHGTSQVVVEDLDSMPEAESSTNRYSSSTLTSRWSKQLVMDGKRRFDNLADRVSKRKSRVQRSFDSFLERRYEQFLTYLPWRKLQLSTQTSRQIELLNGICASHIDTSTNRPFIGNAIRTSKYSIASFLPRQLLFQFSKLANIYFLCISILQLIPNLSTTGTYTTIVPLLVFISISMAKEGYEDLRRHKLDKVENTSRVQRLRPRGAYIEDADVWESCLWQQLLVGDVVKLGRDSAVPADLMLLWADTPENAAFVETMALDGETNLKPKTPPASLATTITSTTDVINSHLVIHVEEPNADLYNLSGKVKFQGQETPLNNNEILYRGSILRNTQTALGVIVYSGEECKIRMNATKNPRIKSPQLQKIVNRVVAFIVALVILLALGLTASYNTTLHFQEKAWYLHHALVPGGQVFVSFVIMLNTMIPLSLYVSLEIVKVCQIALMMFDADMYDDETNTPMEARTSTINEELGQVNYVFSDKTGTLTDNIMNFKKMSVLGSIFSHTSSNLLRRASFAAPSKKTSRASKHVQFEDHSKDVDADSSNDDGFVEGNARYLIDVICSDPESHLAQAAHLFLLSIVVCHTCSSEISPNGADISYQATSPDELALLEAAQELGYVFVDRRVGVITIRRPGVQEAEISEKYTILNVLEFNSKRKRMSVLVRMPDNRICLVTKGADSIVQNLLRMKDLVKKTTTDLQRQATVRKNVEGNGYVQRELLRQSTVRKSVSLASDFMLDSPLGRKSSLSRKTSFKRSFAFDPAVREGNPMELIASPIELYTSPTVPNAQITTRSSLARPDTHVSSRAEAPDTSAVYERTFKHIELFAIEGLRTLLYAHRFIEEDEYQAWNSEFAEASVSIYDRQSAIDATAAKIEKGLELTGATAIEDKLQDGVPLTIDRLHRANIKVWVLTGDKRETALNVGKSCQLIKDFSVTVILDIEKDQDLASQILLAKDTLLRRGVPHSVVVIDGATLAMIEDDRQIFDSFHSLAIQVSSVLCCRASPAQKALLVRSVRLQVRGAVTLAIGDGANDVAMLQEAHLGIGIAGREGLQAARTSDYSIGQFKFLAKLLLVHGRWNYLRICKYTLGTFWKELMFFITQAMFQQYNLFTGTSLYEPWSLSVFNTLFTSLCVIFLGVLEKDLKSDTLLAIPELYNYGQKNKGFNLRVYLGWSVMSVTDAALIFYLPVDEFFQQYYGHGEAGLYALGSLCFGAAVIIINLKLQFWEIHYKTIFCAISIVLCTAGWFLWQIILSATYKNNTIYHVKGGFLSRWGHDGFWWLGLVMVLVVVYLWELLARAVRTTIRPTDVDLMQELEKNPVAAVRLRQLAATGTCDVSPPSVARQQSLYGTSREDGGDIRSHKHVHSSSSAGEQMPLTRAEREQSRKEAEVRDILQQRGILSPTEADELEAAQRGTFGDRESTSRQIENLQRRSLMFEDNSHSNHWRQATSNRDQAQAFELDEMSSFGLRRATEASDIHKKVHWRRGSHHFAKDDNPSELEAGIRTQRAESTPNISRWL